jgi:hypothetical protein
VSPRRGSRQRAATNEFIVSPFNPELFRQREELREAFAGHTHTRKLAIVAQQFNVRHVLGIEVRVTVQLCGK